MNNINSIKDEIIKYGDILDAKSFSPGTSGNISVRVDDKILITTSGSSNGALTYDDLVLIDFDGNTVNGGKHASSEKLLHIEFYKKRPDIKAIIHVHPPFLCGFAAARKPLDAPIMAENVFYFGQIPLADYGMPSSMTLVDNTAKYFDKYDAVIMANHGFIAGSDNIKDAYLKVELAESYAQVVLNAQILGGAVSLSPKDVEDIENLKK